MPKVNDNVKKMHAIAKKIKAQDKSIVYKRALQLAKNVSSQENEAEAITEVINDEKNINKKAKELKEQYKKDNKKTTYGHLLYLAEKKYFKEKEDAKKEAEEEKKRNKVFIGKAILFSLLPEKVTKEDLKLKYKYAQIVTYQGFKFGQRTRPLTFNIRNDGGILDFQARQTYKFIDYTLFPTRKTKNNESRPFKRLRRMLENDADMAEDIKRVDDSTGLEMIVIMKNVQEFSNNHASEKIDLTDLTLFDNFDNNVIAHKYISYDLNKDAKEFHELFKKEASTQYVLENNKTNSCFLNLIVDTFKPSFDKAFQKHLYCETLHMVHY